VDDLEYAFLRRQWLPIGRSEDLTAEKPLAARLLDKDLVLYRVAGVATAAGAYCPHRGMNLSMGTMVRGGLECPYHGWRFGADGKCVAIPSLPEGAGPGVSRLRLVRCTERYGHIWAVLDPPDVGPPEIPELDDGSGWQILCGVPHDLPCGIRQLTENFRDIAHFPFVHGPTMGPNVTRVVPSYSVNQRGRDLIWSVPMDLGGTAFDSNQGVAGRQDMTYHLTLPCFSRIRTEFPDGGRRYTVQLVAPLDRYGQAARQFWLVAIDRIVNERHHVNIEEMFDYERRIFEEDWPILANQDPAEPPLDLRQQAHTRADAFSIKYRRSYQDLLLKLQVELETTRFADANQEQELAQPSGSATVGVTFED